MSKLPKKSGNLISPKHSTLTHVDPDKLHENIYANRTKKTYASGVNHFLGMGYSLPTNSETICQYLKNCLEDCSYSTVCVYLASIATWHKLQKFEDPTKSHDVKMMKKSFRRVNNAAQKQSRPLTLDLIERKVIPSTFQDHNYVRGLRDRALILTGYYCLMRCSELQRLNVDDIEVYPDRIKVRIAPSKHDPDWHRVTLLDHTITHCPEEFCPVPAIKEWIECLPESDWDSSKPLFRGVRRGGNIRPSGLNLDSISRLIQRRVHISDVSGWDKYTGHAMRRGWATDANDRGFNLVEIQKAGRWQDLKTVERYIDSAASSPIGKMQMRD